jgi:hypothetical protein
MSLVLANCKGRFWGYLYQPLTVLDIMIIRVYTLWDHRKAILRTLYVAYFLSVCASIAFVFISIKQLLRECSWST